MKILDPLFAPLPLPELHKFLSTRPARQHVPNRIGGYKTVDLRGYRSITREFNDYLRNIATHVTQLPSLEYGWLEKVIAVLSLPKREDVVSPATDNNDNVKIGGKYGYGLSKGEVLMIIELGLGMSKLSLPQASESAESNEYKTEEAEREVSIEGNVEPDLEAKGAGRVEEAAEAAEEQEWNQDAQQLNRQEAGEEGPLASATQVLHAVVEELPERFSDDEITEMLLQIRSIVEEARVKEAQDQKNKLKGKSQGHGRGNNRKGKGKMGGGKR